MAGTLNIRRRRREADLGSARQGKRRARGPAVVLEHTPQGVLARTVAWLESLPEGIEREAVILCGSPLLRHRLRTHVAAELGKPGLLVGVRIVSPARRARRVLAAAGEPATRGAGAVRRLRLREVLRRAASLGLTYFDPAQVAREQGYIEAFARTVGALEQAGLRPRDLWAAADDMPETDARRVRDVGLIWYAVEGDQGHTDASAYRRAAGALEDADRAVPHLALVTETPDASIAVFFEALRIKMLIYLDARPHTPTAARRRELMGLPKAPPITIMGGGPQTELARLKARLFLPGNGIGPGYDGTVEMEAYASVEEEMEAAVTWVVDHIQKGAPLSRIALVVPRIEVVGSLLIDRLARADPPIPAYLAGGRPRGETPAGLRVLAMLDALSSGLEAEATIRCLPWLVTESHEPVRDLAPSRAAELVYGAGILGGTSRDLKGGLEWAARLERRHAQLRERILTGLEPEGSTSRARAEAWLRDAGPRLPAVRAMERLLRRIAEDEIALDVMAPEFLGFVQRWLSLPEDPSDLLQRLALELEALARDKAARRLRGRSALAAVHNTLSRARVPVGRLGGGVFVGSPRHCAGVGFDAVRFMGLAEGVFPRMPHDDPVLPSDLRQRVEAAQQRRGHTIRRLEDDLDDELHTFHRIVAGAGKQLALSIPGQWIDRTERSISGVILEVLNALGVDVRETKGLSSLGHLQAERLRPGAARMRALALAQGSTPRSSFMARRARFESDGHVPPSWLPEHELALFAAVDAPTGDKPLPGLTPDRPLSPTWLKMLLGCPFRFLQEKILARAPTEPRPPTDRLEPRAFGTLVHDASETFFGARGTEVCAQEGQLDDHLAFGRQVLEETFEAVRATYPLRGGETADRELDRAWRLFEEVLKREWARPARVFDAIELPFGFDAPVGLDVGDKKLYLRGRIDRLDQVDGGLSVRDLKTGRGRSLKEEGVNAGRDFQLGLYTAVLETQLRPGQKVVEASYVFPDGTGAPSRTFEGDALEDLRVRTKGWLEVAVGLLEASTFPRTSRRVECRTCAFLALCGQSAADRSREALAKTDEPALMAFHSFKESEDV